MTEKPKAKRDYYPHTFLPIWLFYTVLVYPLGGLMAIPFTLLAAWTGLGVLAVFYGYMADDILNVITALGPSIAIGLALGVLQKNALRRCFGWSATYWRGASLLGAGVGASVVLVFFKVTETDPSLLLSRWLFVMPIFSTCVALCQWFILRHTVEEAWCWIAANLLGGVWHSVCVGMIVAMPLLLLGGIVFAVLGQGLITGMALKFLFEECRL